MPHPTGYVGNEAVRLITPAGARRPTNSKGEMGPTQQLLASPYIMRDHGLDRFGLGPQPPHGAGARAPMCLSMSTAIIIGARTGGSTFRAITNPAVTFKCGGEKRAHDGRRVLDLRLFLECHGVHNGGTAQRIHLVLDTVGGGRLRESDPSRRASAVPKRSSESPGPFRRDGLAFRTHQ